MLSAKFLKKYNVKHNEIPMAHHHHPAGPEENHQSNGHGRKKWLTYLFEFFMLFFAVFCGFQADYLLEHKIERDREKQFIVSMIKEIRMDSKELGRVQNDSSRYKYLDTLALNIFGGDRSLENLKRIRRLYLTNATNYWYMSFNKNTLTQLKNAGNMRLIRNFSVVDSLNQLDNLITYTEKSLDEFKNFGMGTVDLLGKIFNMTYSVKNGKWISFNEFDSKVKTTGFITHDEQLLTEFGHAMKGSSVLLRDYHHKLEDYRKYSVQLVAYLIKEYHLEKQ